MSEEEQQFDTFAEEQAYQLTQAALRLDRNRESRENEPGGLVDALSANLEVWVAIRTAVNRDDCMLDDPVRSNLTKLSQFVADKTFSGAEIADVSLDALININLQIAEGLLAGARRD